MDLNQKLVTIKALSEEGQLQAVISTFGQIDRDGDIMLADAFADSNGKSIPLVWAHQWDAPIGKGTVSVTQTEAIFTGQFFLDTGRGADAYRTVKAMGALQEFSIGFRIKEADFGYVENDAGQRLYVRTIKDIELFEASPVLVGAAYGTRVLAIKAAASDPEDLLTKALADIEAELKAGRSMSQANLDRMHAVMQQFGQIHDGVCDMGDECPMVTTKAATNPVSTVRERTLKEIEARAASLEVRNG